MSAINPPGPGVPDLLTVKDQRLLLQCDALVYDSLVPREVLALVLDTAEKHFVGKRRRQAPSIVLVQAYALVMIHGCPSPPTRSAECPARNPDRGVALPR